MVRLTPCTQASQSLQGFQSLNISVDSRERTLLRVITDRKQEQKYKKRLVMHLLYKVWLSMIVVSVE